MHMRHRPKTISKKLDEKAINQKWKKYKTTITLPSVWSST